MTSISTSSLALLLALAGCASPAQVSPRPPNVILFLTDDQGWADLGCQGARGFRTPRLDRLACEGLRLTDFTVAQPVCSASRAGLLTGCYPNRIGITGALGPDARHGLAEGETTLAELCRTRGHATAIYGKWHLGHRPEFSPLQHGFDEFWGIPYSNDMHPLHPEAPAAYPPLPLLEGAQVVELDPDQDRFTAEATRRAVAFIEANAQRPFFLYLPYPMPHVPLHASSAYRGRSERGLYGDVIEEIDASVGAVLDALARAGLTDDTLVLFTSDNGPWLSYGDHGGSAGPLREGKGTTFEGGVRVPFLARWPGHIPPGRVSSEPAMTIDVLPTVAHAIGAALPSQGVDGVDLMPLFTGSPNARLERDALFFYYGKNALEAVRSGRWKLHFPHGYRSMEGREPGRGGRPGKYDYDRRTGLELYDLEQDRGESRDVAAEYPEVVERLAALADAMREDLGDDLTGVAATGARAPGRAQGD